MMLKVCKFGGSSLADAAQLRKVRDIVLADSDRRIVVVSAPGKRQAGDTKVTDLLIDVATRRLEGRPVEEPVAAVTDRFSEIRRELDLPPELLSGIVADLRERIASFPGCSREAFLDRMKAFGEDACARMMAALLACSGAEASYVNPGEAGMLLSDEFGNARLLEESYERLRALGDRPGILVVPGFFGHTRGGDVVTFSRGGSDITGAILAAALGADVYENFTDVDCVFAVDPRIVPDVTHSIEEMTYREMRELSYAGFAVFHEDAVMPAIRAGVPIWIRNTHRPEGPGTRIVSARTPVHGTAVGIASADGFCCVYVDKFMMNREIGFGRQLLQIFEEEGVPYEHMPSGIDNVSVVVNDGEFSSDTESRVVRRIHDELHPDAILVERGHALIMVVGEGMHYTRGLAARATAALAGAGVNIEMMNQGASEISMMFGVRSEDRPAAVTALYEAFFKNGERTGS